MKHAQDTQAVSPVIGFILVVGILIAVLASVQLVLVPMWNQDIEFSHNQRMQSSMQQLDSKINNVMQSGTRDSITLELGADIPKRPLLFDLPNQPGSLRTGNNSVVSIQNAAALNPDAAGYWDGGAKNYSTRSLIFEPSYYEYDDAPRTIISNSLVYNNDTAAGTNALLDSTAVIDGRRITLVTLDGNLSVASMSTNVDLEPVSTPTDSLAITNTTDNVTLNISTELNQTDWDLILEDQMTDNGGYVENVTVNKTKGFANITLARTEGGEQVTYELTLAKIGVGNGITEEGAHYATKIRGDGASVPENGTQVLTVEVRDRLNNPVSGTTVHFEDPGQGDIRDDRNVSTGSNGRASVVFEASDTLTDPVLVNASINGTPDADFNSSRKENVTFNMSAARGVPTPASGMSGEWINSGHPAGVLIDDVVLDGNRVRVTFENTNDDEERTMQSARVSVATRACEPQSSNDEIECGPVARQWEIIDYLGPEDVGEDFEPISGGIDISSGLTESIEIEFYSDTREIDHNPVAPGLQSFIISIEYEDAPRGTYYVPVPESD